MEIVTSAFAGTLHGLSGVIRNGNAWESGRGLMGRMWTLIKTNGIANKGLNHWFYGGGGKIFVGVELNEEPDPAFGFESVLVNIPKYIYYKHVGPYNQIDNVYQLMRAEIRQEGLEESPLSLEIYGHDKGPDSVPEVELFIGLK